MSASPQQQLRRRCHPRTEGRESSYGGCSAGTYRYATAIEPKRTTIHVKDKNKIRLETSLQTFALPVFFYIIARLLFDGVLKT